MKPLLFAAVLALLPAYAAAGTAVDDAKSPSNVGGMRGDQKAEAVIRELYDQFEAAWNRHDPKAIAAMWTIDGDHVEPDGTVAKGRDQVEALMVKQHETIFKDTTLGLTINDVWFVTANVALVDGDYEVTGAKLPDGTPIPARKGHVTAILLRERGDWSIAASRLMIPTQLPYKKKS